MKTIGRNRKNVSLKIRTRQAAILQSVSWTERPHPPKMDKIIVRMDPTLKKTARTIFARLGLSEAAAIRLLYARVILHQGMPFALTLPNAATRAAFAETAKPDTLPFHISFRQLRENMGASRVRSIKPTTRTHHNCRRAAKPGKDKRCYGWRNRSIPVASCTPRSPTLTKLSVTDAAAILGVWRRSRNAVLHAELLRSCAQAAMCKT